MHKYAKRTPAPSNPVHVAIVIYVLFIVLQGRPPLPLTNRLSGCRLHSVVKRLASAIGLWRAPQPRIILSFRAALSRLNGRHIPAEQFCYGKMTIDDQHFHGDRDLFFTKK